MGHLGQMLGDASMRPPLNAGENRAERGQLGADNSASMRPPLNAGENTDDTRRVLLALERFNEAPAERGGKRSALAATASASAQLQ